MNDLFWPTYFNPQVNLYWPENFWQLPIAGGTAAPEYKVYKKVVGSGQWR
jgi:hypothetical protein